MAALERGDGRPEAVVREVLQRGQDPLVDLAGADVVVLQNSHAPVLTLALETIPEHEPARSVYLRGAAMLGLDATA